MDKLNPDEPLEPVCWNHQDQVGYPNSFRGTPFLLSCEKIDEYMATLATDIRNTET